MTQNVCNVYFNRNYMLNKYSSILRNFVILSDIVFWIKSTVCSAKWKQTDYFEQMDNYEFNLMDINDQASYTWDNGTYLASRTENDYSVNLYWVDKFFVEVFYDHKGNFIDKIRSFKSTKPLEKYTEHINIDIAW